MSALAVLLAATPQWTAVAVWNTWRTQNPQIKLDFRYAVIPGDLSLAAADLHGADFTGASLQNANLRCSRLSNATFYKADLRGADLSASDLTDADLTASDLRGADFRGAKLCGVNFGTGAIHSQAIARRSSHQVRPLDTCDLSGADLRTINLEHTNLTYVRLNAATLTNANLSASMLAGTDLRGADLRSANLEEADLTDADLSHADLTDSNLRRAHLIGTTFDGAQLSGARLAGARMGWTTLSGAQLFFACELDQIRHLGPSVMDTDTLIRCFGAATDSERSSVRVGVTAMTVFFRGVGVPENILELARSRSFAARHASCFISYSSANVEFARKIFGDLQDEGVRCWFAPDEMRVGEDIKTRIQKSIEENAKVIVVLSQASLMSQWVRVEVDAALVEERRKDSESILLPIAIDDAYLSAGGWVSEIRKRNVGDFRGWAKQDNYRAALRRLIEDLLTH
ncbi:MAG: toll/interleukin-1 receptor domain-containing protein [Acidobacteriota bacterium]|nr:toll/interleukin-1 receptor domain-containing protein [Acidobacteriota bacterium]